MSEGLPITDLYEDDESGIYRVMTPGEVERRNKLRAAEQSETRKNELFTQYEESGIEHAKLIHTPEGQARVKEVRDLLVHIVDETSNKPYRESTYDLIGSDLEYTMELNEQFREAWEKEKEDRVEKLLIGERTSNGENAVFLEIKLGKRPGHSYTEEERREIIDFEHTRQEIGRALQYKEIEDLPQDERVLPWDTNPESPQFKFYGVKLEEAHKKFAEGWDKVRNSEEKVRRS